MSKFFERNAISLDRKVDAAEWSLSAISSSASVSHVYHSRRTRRPREFIQVGQKTPPIGWDQLSSASSAQSFDGANRPHECMVAHFDAAD